MAKDIELVPKIKVPISHVPEIQFSNVIHCYSLQLIYLNYALLLVSQSKPIKQTRVLCIASYRKKKPNGITWLELRSS